MDIQHRILPHRECDVRCDAEANIHYDIVLRCCGSDVDVEQEHDTFQGDSKLSDGTSKPRKKRKVSGWIPTEEEEMDKFRKRIKEAFRVIEVKKSVTEDGKPTTYARLGMQTISSLCPVHAQHHHPLVPIDMRTSKGRKQFIDDYIRLSLCPKYRVGYDPTKTWLPDLNRWEVECFDTNQSNNEQGAKGPCESVHVDPEPITSGGHLFGRRTRCHLAYLPNKDEPAFVLKESWTEVDGKINTVEVPNEVRIFKHIEEVDRTLEEESLTENGIPKMKYGGAVCIKKEDVHGDTGQTGQWCYDTMSRYCGELKVVTDRSPSASQGESAKSENVDEPKEWVERVHQSLLLTPAGKPMTTLHPYDTEPEVPTKLPPEKASDFNYDVVHFFQQLFLTIHTLHKDHNVYHRDLSEGNVLVVENELPNLKKSGKTVKILMPLLIDFSHARLKDDDVVDRMLSRMGTLPFMSILNLAAGGSKGKVALDPAKVNLVERGEAQPVQGGAPHLSFEEKKIHQWVSNQSIEAIEDAKRLHMHSQDTFTMVLKELRPEFRRLEDFFHDLRDALFTWEGGSGAIITKAKKTTAKATAGLMHPRTGHTDPQGLASDVKVKNTEVELSVPRQLRMRHLKNKENKNTTESTVEMHDPLLERAKHEKEVTKKFFAVMMSG
ncbi:hypothetical protein IWQ61_010393, partial [Dispira simplex]